MSLGRKEEPLGAGAQSPGGFCRKTGGFLEVWGPRSLRVGSVSGCDASVTALGSFSPALLVGAVSPA